MTGGKDKAVAVKPVRVARVVAHVARPQHVGHDRCTHRQAGMPGVGLLHRIDREEANGVDALGIEICSSLGSFGYRHGAFLPVSSMMRNSIGNGLSRMG